MLEGFQKCREVMVNQDLCGHFTNDGIGYFIPEYRNGHLNYVVILDTELEAVVNFIRTIRGDDQD